MAAHVTASQITNMPVMPIDWNEIQSGDLLFTSGNYLVSKAIQEVTDSPWSHVGILFKVEETQQILLLESVEDMGVRFAPISKYTEDYGNGKPYKGKVVLSRCNNVDSTIVKNIASFGISSLTRPYDKEEIGIILARITLGIGKKPRDNTYICSELVYECFAHAGIQFAYNPKGFISPEDVWIDPKVNDNYCRRIL